MIPEKLQNTNFRFCLIEHKSKKPLGDEWQKNGYEFNNSALINWIDMGNNYGVISGFGNLRVIDIDKKEIAEKILSQLDTFTVKTGSGNGLHFYIICDYNTNHVFSDKIGEFRAQSYQVVGPNSTHPTGNKYEIINNTDIRHLTVEELLKIITPYIRTISETSNEQISVDKKYIENNILPNINNFINSLITLERTEEQLKEAGFPSRSERDAKVVSSLLYNGFGPYIKSIFELYPVGDKYREHTNGEKYLSYTISTCRAFTGIKEDYSIKLEKEINELPEKILKNKLESYIEKLIPINDWLKRLYLINLIAFKIKISSKVIEKKLTELVNFKNKKEPITLSNLMSKNIKSPEYWIHPIIPKGALIIVGGKPESFKSLFCLSCGLHMKENKDFLVFKTDGNPKILYYDLENGEETQFWRTKYLIKGAELSEKCYDGFAFHFSFNSSNLKQELDLCKDYDIIVLDSYRRFLDGAEDKSDVTNRFFNDFLFKLREQGKTVIIIHHFRKQKLEEFDAGDILDAFRGSGDITAQLDIVYGVFRGNEVETPDKKIKFDVSIVKGKVRNVFPVQNFVFNVYRDDKNKDTKLEFVGFKKMTSAKDARINFILELIKSKADGIERKAIIAEVSRQFGIGESQIEKDINELLKICKIRQDKQGFYKIY
jgi:hypothetical protein